MSKRPSLFAPKAKPVTDTGERAAALQTVAADSATTKRPPSRAGKRVLSIYLDPLA